jgi:hypothetical protein
MTWRSTERNNSQQPRIEVNAYATPLASAKDNFACAVMNLSPAEVKLVKACASAIQRMRTMGDRPAIIQIPVEQNVPTRDLYSFGDLGTPENSDDVQLNQSIVNGRGEIEKRAVDPNALDYEAMISRMLRERRPGELMPDDYIPLLRRAGYPLETITDRNMMNGELEVRTVPQFMCRNGHPLKTGTSWCNRCDAKDREIAKQEIEDQKYEPVNTSRFGSLDF